MMNHTRAQTIAEKTQLLQPKIPVPEHIIPGTIPYSNTSSTAEATNGGYSKQAPPNQGGQPELTTAPPLISIDIYNQQHCLLLSANALAVQQEQQHQKQQRQAAA